MSIADKISRLAAAKTAIANAITGKGGTVGSGDGFEDFATDIGTIPTGGNIETGKTYTVSASGSQTISPSTGYDGMDEVALSVPSGALSTPTIANSTGVVTAGVGTAGWLGTSATATLNLTTKAAATFNVSSSDQSISANQWLTGKQTIRKVTTENIEAANIKSGVTIKVGDAGSAGRIKNITGTYTGSSWTLLASEEKDINTTSTSAVLVHTWRTGLTDVFTASKIIYVKIRDKAGPRNGYFLGQDAFYFNANAANGSTTIFSQHPSLGTRVNSSGEYEVFATGGYASYGVYPTEIDSSGGIKIYKRYSSSYSLTVNGTYRIEVYALDYAPNQGNPFNYTYPSS